MTVTASPSLWIDFDGVGKGSRHRGVVHLISPEMIVLLVPRETVATPFPLLNFLISSPEGGRQPRGLLPPSLPAGNDDLVTAGSKFKTINLLVFCGLCCKEFS